MLRLAGARPYVTVMKYDRDEVGRGRLRHYSSY